MLGESPCIYLKIMTSKSSHKKSGAKQNPFVVLLALLPILIILAGLWVLKSYFGLSMDDVRHWLEGVRHSPFAIPILIAVFIAGSFLSLPQWALFVSAMAVFGPFYGGFLSWIASLVSASVNFGLGRKLGHKRLEAYVNVDGRVDRFLKQLRENGFLASFAVRFVPTGPFVFVNMLAGTSGIKFLRFIGGTALGIIPKILVVALLTQGLITDDKRWSVMLIFTFAACGVAGLIWVLKRRFAKAD